MEIVQINPHKSHQPNAQSKYTFYLPLVFARLQKPNHSEPYLLDCHFVMPWSNRQPIPNLPQKFALGSVPQQKPRDSHKNGNHLK